MKRYMLLVLIVITLFISGCNQENEDKNEQKDDDQVIVDGEPIVDDEKKDDEPIIGEKHNVNVYLFYLSSCEHCHAEREWISTIKDDYPYVNFIMYEYNQYSDLFDSVTSAFGLDNGSFPVTIIGNNYMVGYSESKNRKIIRYIEELAEFESCDIVETVKNNGDVEACMNINKK